MTRAAVLGTPIRHSLSPVLHRAAYAALRLDWTYDAVECDEAALPATLDRLAQTHRGVSLTMPLKRVAAGLVDELDAVGGATGAVNTVLFEPGGRRRGCNTDVAGVLASLDAVGVARLAPGSSAILGGGATAASALAALVARGDTEPQVLVRDEQRAGGLTEVGVRLGARPRLRPFSAVPAVEVVVSTVPAGAADGLAAGGWPAGTALVDVIYAPWPTALGRAAAAAGAPVAGGLVMLVAQAGEQVRRMTGRPPPLEAMRVAGEAALAARGTAR